MPLGLGGGATAPGRRTTVFRSVPGTPGTSPTLWIRCTQLEVATCCHPGNDVLPDSQKALAAPVARQSCRSAPSPYTPVLEAPRTLEAPWTYFVALASAAPVSSVSQAMKIGPV